MVNRNIIEDENGNVYRRVRGPQEGQREGFLREVPQQNQADNWPHPSEDMTCQTCMFYVPKADDEGDQTNLGRCRRRAPTHDGFPAVFETDWCGDHKLMAMVVRVR